jgi:hypothetical protein
MTNKSDSPTNQITFVPAVTTVALTLLIFGRHKKETPPNAPQTSPQAPQKPKKKPTGTTITKYEISEDKIKFQNTKGFFKKRWVTVKEFPVYEISSVESLGNWLSLTWKGETHSFLLKKKADSFSKLQEQIQTMLLEHQAALEKKERATLRRTELLGALNASLPIVDSSFDILLGLNQKRVDWSQIEGYLQGLGGGFSLKPQSLTPLELDFSKVGAAAKNEAAKETSNEAFNCLKIIHDYFLELKAEDDLTETTPNFEHAKAVVLAYYTLNDLLLAKVTGERDSKKEVDYLDELLKTLSEQTNVKLSAEQLLAVVDKLGSEANPGDGVNEVRRLFVEQLKLL